MAHRRDPDRRRGPHDARRLRVPRDMMPRDDGKPPAHRRRWEPGIPGMIVIIGVLVLLALVAAGVL